jgi:Peptidase_C39 like family
MGASTDTIGYRTAVQTRLPAVLAAAALLLFGCSGNSANAEPNAAATIEAPAPAPSPSVSDDPSPIPTPSPSPPPVSAFIKTVPYTVQAPYGVWDAAHEEYCEAAAVLMVGLYMGGDRRSRIPAAEADRDMGAIVTWERATWPGVKDLSLDKVAQDGVHFYNLKPTLEPATFDNIETEVAAGRPVIIPVMTHGAPGGQKIAPNYGSVNVYHVILIVGYDSSQQTVTTNDAGISQGQNYVYRWSILQAAMDAQTPKMGQGRVLLSFSQ